MLTADYSFQTDESFTFDAAGNRTMTGYAVGDNNQTLSDGTYSYTYHGTWDDYASSSHHGPQAVSRTKGPGRE